MATFETKLGTTRAGERTRIWLEGARLLEAGFTAGTLYERRWDDAGKLVLTPCSHVRHLELARDCKGTVSGKHDRPVIDITGARVASTFKGVKVSVAYQHKRITVTDA